MPPRAPRTLRQDVPSIYALFKSPMYGVLLFPERIAKGEFSSFLQRKTASRRHKVRKIETQIFYFQTCTNGKMLAINFLGIFIKIASPEEHLLVIRIFNASSQAKYTSTEEKTFESK